MEKANFMYSLLLRLCWLCLQRKEVEEENVNDKESDTQKDNPKEGKEKDRDKPAPVSMSQYRACLR